MKADGEIVRLVLLGDRDAFAELVARHERAAWATARRIVGDDHIASDAVQEAFLQSFHRLEHSATAGSVRRLAAEDHAPRGRSAGAAAEPANRRAR